MKYIPYTVILTIITSCGIKLGRNDRVKRNLPSVSMQNFLYTYTEKSGFREWEIKAANANIYQNNDKVFIYNFTMTFFTESNKIRTVLVANQGIVEQNIGNLIAEGEVRIFSSNHCELQTEKMHWDQKREIFYSETNKLVTFIRPLQKITGYDMVSDSLLENVTLNNSVGQIQKEQPDQQLEETAKESSKTLLKNTDDDFVTIEKTDQKEIIYEIED